MHSLHNFVLMKYHSFHQKQRLLTFFWSQSPQLNKFHFFNFCPNFFLDNFYSHYRLIGHNYLVCPQHDTLITLVYYHHLLTSASFEDLPHALNPTAKAAAPATANPFCHFSFLISSCTIFILSRRRLLNHPRNIFGKKWVS